MNNTTNSLAITNAIVLRLLHDINLDDLHKDFLLSEDKTLTKSNLHELLEREYGIYIDSERFEQIFKQLDANGDDVCSWEEFITYLMLIFNANDTQNAARDMTIVPLEEAMHQHASKHMFPIGRIRYSPGLGAARRAAGTYMTCSRDGTINTWDIDFQLLQSSKACSPTLKVNKTWILDFIYMADIQMICTSSIECDLRFYDTRAHAFQLQLIICKFPWAIGVMSYWWPQQRQRLPEHRLPATEDEFTNKSAVTLSKIVFGDSMGNVILLSFDGSGRNVFENNTTDEYVYVRWMDVLRQNRLPFLMVDHFPSMHADAVTQIEYCPTLNAIFSSSGVDNCGGRVNHASLVITSLGAAGTKTVITVPKGVQCFDIAGNDDDATVECVSSVVTGGADMTVRLWNITVREKPMAMFPGHQAGITFLCTQDKCKRIYSFDKRKILKVWDVAKETLQQTYNMFATSISDRCFLTAMYNDAVRQLIVGGMQISTVRCAALLDTDITDGTTHHHTVSRILYNPLFDAVITCGFDSSIMNWDLTTGGERLTYVKLAHTMIMYDETVAVEITAACFNTNLHFLLTGAGDGTIKVWDFNRGICLRNLSLGRRAEVTGLHWLPTKILAVGWHRCVTEFSVSPKQADGHDWTKCHREDIIASAVEERTNALATGSHSGELIVWKLDTGRPYLSFNTTTADPQRAVPRDVVKTIGKREVSTVALPDTVVEHANRTIEALVFLSTRPMTPKHGTLVIALSDGKIQFYSHHENGSFLASIDAIHMAGDGCVTLATDQRNEYLFVGTAFGYIKTWYIANYCVPPDEQARANLPHLRLHFPFLGRDYWKGRAKRSTHPLQSAELQQSADQDAILVNSYKGHLRSLTALQYVDDKRLLLSASADCTVRLWTLSGRYIHTLGAVVRSTAFEALVNGDDDYDEMEFRVPPDIRRVASSTTMKVLTGGQSTAAHKPKDMALKRDESTWNVGQADIQHGTGSGIRHLACPILGKHFSIASEFPETDEHMLMDQRLPFVPIYRGLRAPRPSTVCTASNNVASIQSLCFQNEINKFLCDNKQK